VSIEKDAKASEIAKQLRESSESPKAAARRREREVLEKMATLLMVGSEAELCRALEEDFGLKRDNPTFRETVRVWRALRRGD